MKLYVVHTTWGYEGHVIGVCDCEEEILKVKRAFIKEYYEGYKKNIGADYYVRNNIKFDVYSCMREAVWQWNRIQVDEVDMNEPCSVMVYIE